MTIVEKYREECQINEVIKNLQDFDYCSGYQELFKELIDYIRLLEELLGEDQSEI